MRQCGIHDIFHASLLQIHHANDDRLFPGRMDNQIGNESDEGHGSEWAVDKIVGHTSRGLHSEFEIKWQSGDITWLPYDKVSHLEALNEYIHLLGASSISSLPEGKSKPPTGYPKFTWGTLFPILPTTLTAFLPFIATHF